MTRSRAQLPHNLRGKKKMSLRPYWVSKKNKISLWHWRLLLSEISVPLDPSQFPFPSVRTQFPSRMASSGAHLSHFDAVPVQVSHLGEHSGQWVLLVPSLYDPVGQGVPFGFRFGGGSHCALLVGFWVRLFSQVLQFPVRSAQEEHPIWQATKNC